jgi:hypothetical protein
MRTKRPNRAASIRVMGEPPAGAVRDACVVPRERGVDGMTVARLLRERNPFDPDLPGETVAYDGAPRWWARREQSRDGSSTGGGVSITARN